MSKETNFVDIMEPRRRKNDKFSFMSKYWNPKKAYNLDKCYSPQELKDMVLHSVYMEAVIDAESGRTGKSKETLKLEVFEYLEEMGLDKKVYIVRWLGILFLKISLMMKIKVFVNEGAVLQLRASMGKNPVLFLPTHRSYADFCLLTYLCYHYDIEFPAVAAGMDFQAMAVLGRRMREASAFFLRRSLAAAPLYAAALRRYVRALLASRAAPLEFFVEGTRSRANKALPPKCGMLSMALVPLFAGEVSDVTIVPINISYDRLMEQSLFAYEHLGVPKPKESTGGFIRAMNTLNDHFGNIYINFGSPISVRQQLKDSSIFSKETLNPVDLQQLTPDQFPLVKELAQKVVVLQQKNTMVTVSSLLALVLMDHLVRKEELTYKVLLEEIVWVTQVLRDLGASVFENDIKGDVESILLVHSKTVQMGKDERLRLVSSPQLKVDDAVKKKMKGHILKGDTMINAIPIIQLQLYINPVLHYLIPPALLYRLVVAENRSRENLSRDFQTMRRLLKYEFFYLENCDDVVFENALEYCTNNGVILLSHDEEQSSSYMPGSDKKLNFLLSWNIWPFLTIVVKCMDVLMQNVKYDHKDALKHVQKAIEDMTPTVHPYCLSLEAISNCFQGLVLVGALNKIRLNDSFIFEPVPAVMKEYKTLVSLMLPDINALFSVGNPVISSPIVSRL